MNRPAVPNLRTSQEKLNALKTTLQQKVSEEEICPICRDTLTLATACILNCKHVFCVEEVSEWITNVAETSHPYSTTCPVCRQGFRSLYGIDQSNGSLWRRSIYPQGHGRLGNETDDNRSTVSGVEQQDPSESAGENVLIPHPRTQLTLPYRPVIPTWFPVHGPSVQTSLAYVRDPIIMHSNYPTPVSGSPHPHTPPPPSMVPFPNFYSAPPSLPGIRPIPFDPRAISGFASSQAPPVMNPVTQPQIGDFVRIHSASMTPVMSTLPFSSGPPILHGPYISRGLQPLYSSSQPRAAFRYM